MSPVSATLNFDQLGPEASIAKLPPIPAIAFLLTKADIADNVLACILTCSDCSASRTDVPKNVSLILRLTVSVKTLPSEAK